MDSSGMIFTLPSPLTTTYISSQGWYSIRLEMKRMMIFFIGIGFVITTGWSIMFYSIVYRWSVLLIASNVNFFLNSVMLINRSFVQWPYLGCYTVASFILLIASMALGVVCRMNFGKGFAQYCEPPSTVFLPTI